MSESPFSGFWPDEIINGEDISTSETTEILRIVGPDGSVREYVTLSKKSSPDQNGCLANQTIKTIVFDPAGTPYPVDLRNARFSHRNYVILPNEPTAECTFRRHPNGISRTIKLNHDGWKTPDGAICDRCRPVRTVMITVPVIICLGIIAGIVLGFSRI